MSRNAGRAAGRVDIARSGRDQGAGGSEAQGQEAWSREDVHLGSVLAGE